MKKVWIFVIILFAMLNFSAVVQAGLTVVGQAEYNGKKYNLIYEDDQGLIWLDYTNSLNNNWNDYAKWASGLNATGVLTYNFNPGINIIWRGDWRLPNTVDGARKWGCDGTTTAGFNITTSEMGHLFYTSLGNKGYFDVSKNPGSGWGTDAAWGLKNKGPFINLYPDFYWSSEYSIYKEMAWAFSLFSGSQTNCEFKHLGSRYVAVAVRPGRVYQAPVSAN
jgi:hypothetical protein